MRNHHILLFSSLLLSILLLFSLFILPHSAVAQLSLDHKQYFVGEPVTLIVNATNISDPELRIEGPADSYRYLGTLDKSLTFYPSTSGDYFITLRDDGGSIREEENFTIMPQVLGNTNETQTSQNANKTTGEPMNNTFAPFISTTKKTYDVGERVLIMGDVSGVTSPTLALETPAGTLHYGDTLEFPISYQPDVPGEYHLLLQSEGKDVIHTDFTVSNGKDSEENNSEPNATEVQVSSNGSQSSELGDLILAGGEDEVALLQPRRALEAKNSDGRFLDATLTALNSTGGTTAVQQNVTYPEITLVPAHGPVERIRLSHARLGATDTIGLDTIPSAKVNLSGRYVPKAFAIDTGGVNFTNGTATSVAVGTELWKCADWNFSAQLCDGSWTLAMRLTPGMEYAIQLFPGDPGYAETGVASINTRKPLYHPGETAAIVIVVLDREGHLVSGANVTLTITNPSNSSTLFTTYDGEIIETQRGIYETNDSSTSLEGNYSMYVTALGTGVNDTMNSYFTVLSSYAYDLLRDAPVTTDPWAGPFNESLTVDAFAGQSETFTLTERLPDLFTVYDYGGASENVENGSRFLTWRNLTNGSTVSYVARPPYASPDLYTLGPATVEDTGSLFTEARPWYLAVDPTTTQTRFNVSTGNSGYVRDRNCGTSGAATQLMDGSTIYVGRYTTGSGREYRMFVDFDTSDIPDNATINSATLYVYLNTENGEPDDTVSVHTCNYGTTLTNADYVTTLGYNHGTIFTGSSSTGQYHSLSLGTGDGNISLTGDTQLCVWIDGGCSDTNDIFNTLSTNSGNQPYLIVNYTTNAAPTQGTPLLTSSLGYNETTEDLTCTNQSTADADGYTVLNVYSWSVNGTPFEILNTPFEGGSNSTWTKDYSGNANDGLVSGATWNSTGGIVGGAYEFDGVNDYLRFQGDDLSTTGHPFSISFWFKPRVTIDSSISQKMALIEKREGGGSNDWYINFDTADAGRMRWRSYTGNVQTTRNTWVAGTWYHIVGVYGANNDVHIYVNGAEDNRNNDYNIGTLTQSTEDIWVGTRYNGNDDFNGSIDELRIYNRALTPAQVQSLYNRRYDLLKSDETSVGDNWSCEITPNDGYIDGLTLSSANLTVKASTGSPPNITSVGDTPDPVALGSNLKITATVTDPDGDLQTVKVEINGTNYSMTNTSATSWNVSIDTTGFSSGVLAYTVYATDSSAKTTSDSSGSVTVTNTLSVDVSVGSAPHYIGTTLNATTNVTIAGSPVGSAGVTTDIIRVETTSEPITDSWWNTSFKQRVKFTLNDTSNKNRTDYWVSVPIVIDSDCSLDAHNTSLRLVDDEGRSLSFLQWNITACSGNSAYVRSLWISFRLNLTASQSRDFYLYADNSTGHSQVGTTQGPLRIVYVDQGTGSGNFPDTTDINSRYEAALGDLGLSSSGFYDTLSTSRSSDDVPYSSISDYPLVHYSAGSKYRNSWSSVEATNLWKYVNQSGSLLMTGPELGFDANEDGWIFNNVWDNLTHMGAGFQDDSNANNALVQTSHPISAYFSSSFQVSDTYPDGYNTLAGPIVSDVYHWDNGNPHAGTANDGLYDTSCPGMCGKTVYYAGAIIDTGGNGITVGADRKKFLEGVLDWFLNNRSADFSSGTEQHWIARDTGSTISSGILTLGFNSSTWTNTTYAGISLATKSGYASGLDYEFFNMTYDYSNYPNITSVGDTPDPVPRGLILNITATVTDSDNNLQVVWVNINGTNYTMTNTSPTSWNVSINTTGFELTTLTYTVYANDSDGHEASPMQGNVLVSDAFQASVSTDKSQYTIGESVTATTQTYLGFQPTSAQVFTDIIRGTTDTPWWNTSWTLREPFNLSSPDDTDRTNEIVRVNITGLDGNITNCVNQLRIIRGGTSETQVETPFTVESTDDGNWCYVRFLANVTAGKPTRYHAYYNNTVASNPGYSTVKSSYILNKDLESTSSWTYTETETADTGTYTTSQSNSPSQSYNIYSGSSGTAGNYGEIYQDVALPCVGCQLLVSAYNRLESAGTTADAFFGQIIMNTTTISSVGTPGSANSPTEWTLRSGYYNASSSTERLHLRLLTDVTFTGGNYGRRDVYWDDASITPRYPLTFTLGSEQLWTARSNGTSSATTGLLALAFDSSNYTATTYTAVTLAQKRGYTNTTDWTTFLMQLNMSGYPVITDVTDTPDPVIYGQNINISANITSTTGLDQAWIIIDSTTRYNLSNTTTGSPDIWEYTLDTTGLTNGTHTYVIYANDTEGHETSNGTYTFKVAREITVTVTGDKSIYTTGDIADFLTNTTLVGPLSGGSVTTDIIRGSTDTIWWNTSWSWRLPFNLSSSDGTNRTNEIVRVNITGLGGGITNCANQLRIIRGSTSETPVETPFTVESTDDSTWCYVRFLANVTVGTPTRYNVYYNNSGATDPGYAKVATSYVMNPNIETTSSWTYYENEADDTGGYSTAQANSPTHSYRIYSGTTATQGNYAEIYQDVTLPCVGCQVGVSAYNYLTSAGNTVDAFFGQIIMNSTVISSVGTPGSGSSPTPWTKRSGTYTTQNITTRLHLRFLSNVTFTSGYGERDVYWDDVAITLSDPSTASFGVSQEWLARTLNTTDVEGTVNTTFDTTGQSDDNYTAVSLVSASPYDDGSGYFLFKILGDAPPTVTLTSPPDGNLTNQTAVTFHCAATDDHGLVNLTFYNDFSGSWQENGSTALSGTSGSGSFAGTLTADGTYSWNCLAYDNTGKGSFADANKTITLDTLPPGITLTGPADGSTLSSSAVAFRYLVNDTHNISSCRLIINGSVNKTDTSITKANPQYFGQSFSDGSYSWAVSCTDVAGNANTSATRTFTVAIANVTMSGMWYERSDLSSCAEGETCGIDLATVRNATGHSVVFDPVEPSQNVTVVEAVSPFMGTNGAFIQASSLVNFSGEFFTNPVSQGLVTWQLYQRNVSLAQSLICQDANNPLFSTLTGSCSSGSDVYLSPSEQLFLVLTFENDETNNISFTHYWDGSRGSYLNLSLSTVGFLSGRVTTPHSSSYTVAQNRTFTLNCTYSCEAGACFNVQAYAQYDSGSGFTSIGASGALALNGSQANPVSLGNISNGTNTTASFILFANQTGNWPVRCRATDVAETAVTNNVTISVGDNTPPVVSLVSLGNDTFTNQDPVPFTYFANDSSGLANCSLLINGTVNATQDIVNNGQNNSIAVSLPSGTYTWTVICFDNSGLNSTATPSWTIKVDTEIPVLTPNYPLSGEVDTSIVPFNWTVTDNWQGNVTCNLTVDDALNATMNVTTGSPYVYNVAGFSLGQHNWSVSCWDGAYNTNTSPTYSFNITDSAPVVSLISPSDGNMSNTSDWILIYHVEENNGLQWCRLYLDGQLNQTNASSVQLGRDNNFSLTNVQDGLHNWTVECNDTGGQTDTAQIQHFTADTTPPTITPLSPSDFTNFTTTPNVTISFNATDNLSTNLSCNLTINSGAFNMSFNTTSGVGNQTTLYNQSDGEYIWNVTCSDQTGNTNTSQTRRYYINNSPETYLITPSPGAFTNENVTFNYFADDNDNLKNCSIYIDGLFKDSNTEIIEGATNTFSIDNITDGHHTWYILCVDNGVYLNQNQTPARNFTVDTTPPNVILNAPDNKTINRSWVLFNWTATDNVATNLTCNLTIDGSVNDTFSSVINGTDYTDNVTSFANGNHTWNVTCIDPAENKNTSETRWFFINIPPSVYLQSPPNMTFNNTGDWNLTYMPVINNNNSDTAHFVNCSLYINGAYNKNDTNIVASKNNSFILSGVNDSLYNWSVLCYEDSGASGWSDTWFFVQDNQSPQPNITTENDSWFNTATPTMGFNITDNFNYSIDYLFFVNDTPDAGASGSIPGNSTSTDTLSSLSEGIYTILLQATDQAKNSKNSTNRTIHIDLTKPHITLLNPPDGNTTANSTVTFNFTVSDTLSPTLNCNLTIDNNVNKTYTNITEGRTINETVLDVGFGIHYWNVTCIDLATNLNTSETRNFTVPSPDLVITSGNITFSNSTPVENQSITVNATVFNIGQSTASNITVQFYLGDPESGGRQIGANQTITTLAPGQNYTVTVNHTVIIGRNDIYVVVDPPTATNGSIPESNESNNKAFNGFLVGFYDIFSGTTINNLQVANSVHLPVWEWNDSNATGSNVLITDSDSNLDFSKLQALGRNTTNNTDFSDFTELDAKLNATNLSDNINKTWTKNGAPKETKSYTIFKRVVNNVPIINSTNTSAFTTGILWDESDGGTTYNGTQDIAFITQINKSQVGEYGIYDYEARVPATLRDYTGVLPTVVFYVELR